MPGTGISHGDMIYATGPGSPSASPGTMPGLLELERMLVAPGQIALLLPGLQHYAGTGSTCSAYSDAIY